jgi:hypothetical protein
MISIGETLREINPLLFVASMLDPRYNMEVLEFWFMSNVGDKKTQKIVSNLKNVLN